MGFEGITAVLFEVEVFWEVIPCRLADNCRTWQVPRCPVRCNVSKGVRVSRSKFYLHLCVRFKLKQTDRQNTVMLLVTALLRKRKVSLISY